MMEYTQQYTPAPRYILGGGIPLEIKNESEFILFSDIFMHHEYREGVVDLMQNPPKDRPANIVDLGANVGFFSWYTASAMESQQVPYNLTLVEGHPVVYSELMKRLSEVRLPAKAYCGLVGGLTNGYATMIDNGFHHTINRIFKTAPGEIVTSDHLFVQYLNPLDIFPHGDTGVLKTIDLLKLDIEGAEFDFIERFKHTVFAVTTRLLMEVHHDLVPLGSRWEEELRDVGLYCHTVKQTGLVSTQYWVRNPKGTANNYGTLKAGPHDAPQPPPPSPDASGTSSPG